MKSPKVKKAKSPKVKKSKSPKVQKSKSLKVKKTKAKAEKKAPKKIKATKSRKETESIPEDAEEASSSKNAVMRELIKAGKDKGFYFEKISNSRF